MRFGRQGFPGGVMLPISSLYLLLYQKSGPSGHPHIKKDRGYRKEDPSKEEELHPRGNISLIGELEWTLHY
jgi:hypothetical protein